MIRTQIQLTRSQAEALKAASAKRGRSMADLIRASVDELLARPGTLDAAERRRRALSVIGRYRDAPRDLSEAHDRYLDPASRR